MKTETTGNGGLAMDANNLEMAAGDVVVLGQAEDALAVGLLVVNALKLAESTKKNYRAVLALAFASGLRRMAWTRWMPSGIRCWSL